MRKTAGCSVFLLILAAIPLIAQVPDLNNMHVYAPIRVSDAPADPSSPKGILPVQFKAAYGFNRIPNRGQGQTIAIIDPYIDTHIAADVAYYLNYFNLEGCNFKQVGKRPVTTVWTAT